jgi:hypothetical protein
MRIDEGSQGSARRRVSEGVVIALITAGGTVAASVVTGGFGLAGNSADGESPPGGSVATVTVTDQPQAGQSPESATGGSPEGAAASPSLSGETIYLTNLEPVREEENGFGLKEWEDGPVRIDGRDYGHGVAAFGKICTTVREYSISRRYKRFLATAGLADESEVTEPMSLKVTVDGQPKYSEIVRLANPVKIKLDISNGVRLGFIIASTDYCANGGVTVALGDPRLES